MDFAGLIGSAFAGLMNPMSIFIMVAGVAVGIIFGSIPGLSAAMAVALFLPVTFAMAPHEAFTLLVALYIGGISGGLISAILINIPGTPSSIATCFDGSPMAKNGQAAKALGVGVVFSFIGGLISFLILMFIAPSLAQVTLKFSAIEYFGVCIFALSMIAALAGNNMTKGLLAGCLGLIISCVGMAPIDGAKRFTFGIGELSSGFDILPTLIGIFAIAEVLNFAEEVGRMSKATKLKQDVKIKGFGFSMAEFLSQKWNALRSALIGTGIGILEAAAQQKKFAIGVDLDQDDLQPGYILTSMIKNVDTAAYLFIESMVEDTYKGGESLFFDLSTGAVSLTDFSVFKQAWGDKFPQDIVDKCDELKEEIVSGAIVVDEFPGVR